MNSTATAINATAIGSGGSTRETATAATKEGAVAIGGDSVAGARATGKNAIAIGGRSTATQENAVAIGMGSSSTHGNSVALGTGSTADGKNINTAAYKPTGFTGTLGGNTAIGEVSIGKVNSERRITNMAAGSADTDGVNVSQLKALDTVVSGKINSLEQGWKIQSDGDIASAVKASDTVQFNSGTNIDVTRTGNTITVNTTQDMKLNSVSFSDTAGNNSVLSASGLNVSNAAGSKAHYGSEQLVFNQGTANAVSIGNAGINAGNQKITNVADGALSSTSKDAVNGSQLYKTNQNLTQVSNQVTQNTDDIANLSQGWKLQSDNDTASAVKAGDTVQFNSGKNIDVSRDGNTLTIATADDLDLNSVNLQDASGQTLTTLDASGLNVSNADNSLTTNVGAGIINVGGNTHTIAIDGNTGEITGLSNTKYDPNNIQADRAATEGQIADLDQQLTNKGFNISAQGGAGDTVKLGETVDFSNTDGNIEISNNTDNGIQFKLANAISVQSVIAGDTASGNFSVIGSGGTTVTDAAGNVANYGANSSSFTDTAGNSSISSAAGTTLTDAAGNTYITTAEGSVLTNANGDETKLTAAGTEVTDALGNNASYGANGISIGDTTGSIINIANGNVNFGGNVINGVGDGVTAGDAVNKGQLDGLGDSLSSLGLNFAGNAGSTVHKNLGETLSIVGEASVAGNYNGKNVKTETDAAGNLQIQIAENPEFDSVIAGDTASGNFSVIGSGGTTVTDAAGNVANYGANSSSFTDTAGNSSISSATGTTLTDAAGNTYITTAEGSVLTNANGDETKLTAAGTEVTDALGNNASYGANGISIADATGNLSTNVGAGIINVGGSTHTIAIDGNTGEITGLSNTKYDPNNIQADRAATEGQLVDLDNKINNAGFNISAQSGAGDTVTLGETVDFSSSDSNLAVSAGADNQILFTLSSDLTLNSVSMQDAAGNVNYVDATGSRVADALGNNAFYGAIGSQFTDKAGNSFNNSATGSIVTNAAGDSTNVSAGNISVSTGNGGTVSIGGNGIDAGGNNITNVADGKAPGDAVNKGQLDTAVDNINNSIGAAINGGVQYDKNADGTVNKDSITLEGGANGTTITNVANGKVEAGSKDAVNGGQLHDALQQINNNQSTINNDILGVTVGPDGKPKLDLDIYDVANQTKTGDLTLVDAINQVNQDGTKYAHTNAADESEEPGLINPDNNAASAGGKNSSAFGVNAIVDETATNGLAMGYQSQVGAGATNAVSIGSQTQANGESSLALGHGSQANGKQSISIGTGNIVNGNHSGAIGDPSVINGDNSYVLGNNNHIDADNSFAVGNEVTIGKDAADMSKANGASFGGSVGIGNGSTVAAAVGTQNVTIGNTTYEFAGSAPVGTVSVGSKDEERTLTNVAAGRIDATSTDAINGSQLHATNQAVGDLYQMNNKLNNRIDGLEDESRAGVATALAVANLPQVYIPGKSGLAIATGVHKGEVGYALGYSSISEGGNWVFKASATANRMGDVGGGAGLLYMFD